MPCQNTRINGKTLVMPSKIDAHDNFEVMLLTAGREHTMTTSMLVLEVLELVSLISEL